MEDTDAFAISRNERSGYDTRHGRARRLNSRQEGEETGVLDIEVESEDEEERYTERYDSDNSESDYGEPRRRGGKRTAILGQTHRRPRKPNKAGRAYTPDATESRPIPTDEDLERGYPDWFADPKFASVFHDLEAVPLPNRPPSLPRLYRYTGNQHPLRHLQDETAPAETYVYLYDPTDEGFQLACKLGSVHEIPKGPVNRMKDLGLMNIPKGGWLFARSIYNKGDAQKDILQAFSPQRGRISENTRRSVLAARDSAMGPRAERTPEIGCLPVEQYESGAQIQPVRSSQRCYPLGITYEKQTIYSAPNANGKLRNGTIDANTNLRVELTKQASSVFLEGYEETPTGIRQCLDDIADVVAMPHVGNVQNNYVPSAQLNIARPQLSESDTGLEEQGHFGGKHRDRGDSICGFSGMIPLSDLPLGMDPGRFHLLTLGVYFLLDEAHPIYFTGQLPHGGTAPLAAPGVDEIEHWAYRFVIIFYPALRILTGNAQTYMAASGVRGEPVTLPREVFGYDPPRPFGNHANFFTDGGVFTTPQDHFATAMRMFILYGHHLFRQLPYPVNFYSDRICEAISIDIDGSEYFAPKWKHAPAVHMNRDQQHEYCKVSDDGKHIFYPPSTQYPSRQSIIDNFINNYFLPAAEAVPEIGIAGIINEVPITLRPTDTGEDEEILRPRKTNNVILEREVTIAKKRSDTQQHNKGKKGNILIPSTNQHMVFLNNAKKTLDLKRQTALAEFMEAEQARWDEDGGSGEEEIDKELFELSRPESPENDFEDELIHLVQASRKRKRDEPDFTDDDDDEQPLNGMGSEYDLPYDEDYIEMGPDDQDVVVASVQFEGISPIFSAHALEHHLFVIDNALEHTSDVLTHYSDVLKILEDLDFEVDRNTFTASTMSKIPMYMSNLQMLEHRGQMNEVIQNITRGRYLVVENEIYGIITTLCLPAARQVAEKHRRHVKGSNPDIVCQCAQTGHEHEQWLAKLVMRIYTLLTLSVLEDDIDSRDYLKSLEPPRVFPYRIPKQRRNFTSDPPTQKIIDIFKAILFHWFNMPQSNAAEKRSIMINTLQQQLGMGVIFLPDVWSLCIDPPSWIMQHSKKLGKKRRRIQPLILFQSAVVSLEAAAPGTEEFELMEQIWERYKTFILSVRQGPKGLPVAIPLNQNLELSEKNFSNFVLFLRKSLQASKGELPELDPFYPYLCHNPDFFMPLREKAPSRMNATSQENSIFSQIEHPQGFFNLLIFRILAFNTQASRTGRFDFTYNSLLQFMKDNDKTLWYNPRAYGNPCRGWDHVDTWKRYWDAVHLVWASRVKKQKENAELRTFSNFVAWLETVKFQDGRNAFRLVGKLTRVLIAGDLVYAGMLDEPTVDEMGVMIAKISKGGIGGLRYLNLLPPHIPGYPFTPTQVLNAYTIVYNRLKEALDSEEWNEMGMNTLVLEHSLCKVKRMEKAGLV